MTETTKLQIAIRIARSAVTHLEGEVARRSAGLASDLTCVAETVKGNRRVLNSLGELQGNGVLLDVYCARLCDARDFLKTLEDLARDD